MNNHIDFPSPRDLTYFVQIAKTGSLSRAAERLGVGQPGLSLVIKRLETSLGTALFIRQSRGLLLTAAGTRLLNRCVKLHEDWGLLISETKNASLSLHATFRLGCHTAVAQYCLNPFVRDFYREYPDIQFELTHGLSREVCERVVSGGLDFAFAINPIRHPNLVIRKLAEDEVGFWATPGHDPDVLIFEPSLSQSQNLVKKMGTPFRRVMPSSSLEVIASLAESGVGVAILPERVAQKLAPSTKRLRDAPTFKDQIAFIYHSDLPKSQAVTAVITAAKAMKI